jgi:hypothetical protein
VQVAVALQHEGGEGVAALHEPERGAEGDDLPDAVGIGPGHLAGIETAEAPSDQRDRPVVLDERLDRAAEVVDDVARGPDIAAEPPAVGLVVERAEIVAQDRGRVVPGHEPGQHEHMVAVAAPGLAEDPAERGILAESSGHPGHLDEPLHQRRSHRSSMAVVSEKGVTGVGHNAIAMVRAVTSGADLT